MLDPFVGIVLDIDSVFYSNHAGVGLKLKQPRAVPVAHDDVRVQLAHDPSLKLFKAAGGHSGVEPARGALRMLSVPPHHLGIDVVPVAHDDGALAGRAKDRQVSGQRQALHLNDVEVLLDEQAGEPFAHRARQVVEHGEGRAADRAFDDLVQSVAALARDRDHALAHPVDLRAAG
jgi:hypothetical protein